jgi:hypothetical protein
MTPLYSLLKIPPQHRALTALFAFREYGQEVKALKPGQPGYDDYLGLLAVLSVAMQPISKEQVAQWLAPMSAGLSFGQLRTESDVGPRLDAILLALEGLPVFLFTPELQKHVLRTSEFFPSAAAIYKLISQREDDAKALLMVVNRALGRRYDEPLPSPDMMPGIFQVAHDAVSHAVPVRLVTG